MGSQGGGCSALADGVGGGRGSWSAWRVGACGFGEPPLCGSRVRTAGRGCAGCCPSLCSRPFVWERADLPGIGPAAAAHRRAREATVTTMTPPPSDVTGHKRSCGHFGPHEPGQLASDRRDNNVAGLFASAERVETASEPKLGFLGSSDGVGMHALLATLDPLGHRGSILVGPGRLDELAAHMGVAGLGDRTPPSRVARGML